MRKLLLTAALVPAFCFAEYVTGGDATQYTLETLSQIENSGVVSEGNGTYSIVSDVTVSADDSFAITGAAKVKIADGVTVTLDGYADFNAADKVVITRAGEEAAPRGIYLRYQGPEAVTIKNIDFEYASLRILGTGAFVIDNCSFSNSNGALTSAGALCVGDAGAEFEIANCTFQDNTVPAIGGAANYYCGLDIHDCTFINNNTSNTNKPQLNLTVGADKVVSVKNCKLQGTGLNMVGGIAVGNLMGQPGDNKVFIEGCVITGHRYGITGAGPMYIEIRNNVLKDNHYEDVPNNGGSGISLSGYSYMGYELRGIVADNHIENNLWGITIIYCTDVNCGEIDNPASPGRNVFISNGFDDQQYDLYNYSPVTVYAQNNTWSVPEQTEENIENVIFHKADDPSMGEVIFMPPYDPSGIADAMADASVKVENGIVYAQGAVELFDLQGCKVAAFDATNGVSIKHLPQGVYILKHGSSTAKVVR